MAIEKHQEISGTVRDHRTVDAKITGFLSRTNSTLIAFGLMALLVLAKPWTFHLFAPVTLIWWVVVGFDRKRQVLPYYLPQGLKRTDYNNPKDGATYGFKQADGIFFLGNAVQQYAEVWESSSAARQHHLVFGTTGGGKSEMLMGLYANYIMLGAGCVYSDAKGTPEMASKTYNIARRFGRDVDFFLINYITGGTTVRGGRKDRLSNKANPCSFASVDQINNLFLSFLPKSSGENQIFQDKAISMFTGLTPALVDRRDLHREPLNVPKIRNKVTSLNELLELALDSDKKLGEKARDIIINYLKTLPNFDFDAFRNARMSRKPYEIHSEAGRMFSYAQNYFMRALNSLADTYGHIYNVEAGEVDYLDVVLNRRILLIALPALEKATAELNNLAKINLANLRGAVAYTLGSRVEGHRLTVLDNLPSTSETPTGVILDEYGYQATEGFAITLAQARSLGFSITIAGQDLSNLKMGSEQEADATFGNAVLTCLNIRNLKDIGDRIKETVGEADVAVDSGYDRNAGVVSGYMNKLDVSVQRRYRVTSSDLIGLKTGEAFMFVGRNIGTIRLFPFAPLPDKSETFTVNRFLPVSMERVDADDGVVLGQRMTALVTHRIEGRTTPASGVWPSKDSLPVVQALHRAAAQHPEPLSEGAWRDAVRSFLGADATNEATASPPMPPATASRPLLPAAVPATLSPPVRDADAEPEHPRLLPRAPLEAATAQQPPRAGFFGMPPLTAADEPETDDDWNDPSIDQPPTSMRLASEQGTWEVRHELDTETPEDATGNVNDETCLERIATVDKTADMAQRAIEESGRPPRRHFNATAPANDLATGISQSARHQPPPDAPTKPIPAQKLTEFLVNLDTQVQTASTKNKNRDVVDR